MPQLSLDKYMSLLTTDELAKRLSEARSSSSVLQQAAADALQVSRATMVNIEKGIRRSSLDEVIKLCLLYEIEPIRLLEQDLDDYDLITMFRTLQEQDLGFLDSSDHFDQAISDLQKYAYSTLELEKLLNKSPVTQLQLSYKIDEGKSPIAQGENIAKAERNRLNLGNEPIINLRQVMESHYGIRVFQFPMSSKISGLYGYTPSLGACIAINSNHPAQRRRNTEGHELGHNLADPHGKQVIVASDQTSKSFHEKFAISFSIAFNTPKEGVREAMYEIIDQSPDGQPKVSDILALAHKYRVSFEAIIKRLVDIDMLTKSNAQRIIKNTLVKHNETATGIILNPTLTDFEIERNRFPESHLRNAVEAYTSEILNEQEIRTNYLWGINRQNFARLIREYTSELDIIEDGKIIRYEMQHLNELVELRRV